MEKARYNTELYSNLRAPLNNVKPSNFWGSHHFNVVLIYTNNKVKLKEGKRRNGYAIIFLFTSNINL